MVRLHLYKFISGVSDSSVRFDGKQGVPTMLILFSRISIVFLREGNDINMFFFFFFLCIISLIYIYFKS